MLIDRYFKCKTKAFFNKGIKPELFYWRNNTGNEIDCILQEGATNKVIEIKSAQTINNSFFKGIQYYQKLSGINTDSCYLIYGGSETRSQSDAMVLSWKDLNQIY